MSVRVSILGVPIDAVTLSEAVARIREFLASGGQHHIMTPNPEMLVEASCHREFRQVFLRSSLNVPDGTGILWASRLYGLRIPERVTGVDLLSALCGLSDIGTVFLLGAAPGVAEQAAAALKRQNPALRIVGTHAGSPAPEEDVSLVSRIHASGASLLFVAYGAPAQDLWIARNLSRMPLVKVAMGIGGAFDFLAGVRRRAPGWVQRFGLEWLWRLLQEPSRMRRIFSAVVVFPWLVFTAKDRR